MICVLRASGLPQKGGLRKLVGQHKPDCYVKLSVGAVTYTTNVVKNSCDPEFEQQWFQFPLETFKGHFLFIRLYDHDSMSRDEFLGRSILNIESINKEDDEINTILVGDDSEKSKYDEVSGDLTFKSHWLQLVDVEEGEGFEPLFEGQSVVAMVTIFVYCCNNLMEVTSEGNVEDSLPTTR